MHLEILDKKRINLLKELESCSFISTFAMGGGTGLSLQLGLRESFDFDFFTNNHFNIKNIESELEDIFKDRLIVSDRYERKSTLTVFIDDVQVSFFEYVFPCIFDCVNLIDFKNIKLLNPKDILAMKVAAINQRGSKKDFYDFAVASTLLNITSDEIVEILKKKFDDESVLVSFSFSMIYFDDAEDELLPKTYINKDWEEIKKYYLQFVHKYTHSLKKA